MYIEKINSPQDVKALNTEEMKQLAQEMRTVLIKKLSIHGGHFGPNLGMAEAIIALHYVFNSPVDKFVFDVSHQSYCHKILTGRKDAFIFEDKYDDVSGYANPDESEHDLFNIGHTSTSVSLASGLAKARDLNGGKENVIAVILLTIPGSDQVNKLYMATAPGDFDEIKLVQCGVDAKVLSAINIKYAFVGKAREYTITNNEENGISKYAEEQGRKTFTLDAQGQKPTHTFGEVSRGDVIDANLNNGYAAVTAVLVPVSTPVTVVAKPSDDKEAFPKGTEVGFKINGLDVAKLSIGDGAELTLFNKDNQEIGTYKLSSTVLGIGVLKANKDGEIVMKAPAAFSAVKIYFTGVGIKIGGTTVNYAFVRMAPDAASHHCPINATSSRDVSGSVNHFQLQHNDTVQVEWSIVDRPTGSNVELNTETGLVSNLDVPGKYVFKATVLKDEGRSEKCYELTTLNYAPTYVAEEHGVDILVNKEGEARIHPFPAHRSNPS